MHHNRTAPRFALGKHSKEAAPLELSPEDWLALICLTISKANELSITSASIPNSDLFHLTRVQPSIDLDHLLPESVHAYRVTWDTYEHGRLLLLSIVRPFLPHTTWTEVVEIVQHGGRALPTRTHEASILWLDIANFTEFVDNHPLDKVLSALNAYLDTQTQLIYCHHGDVNKYLGDGFLSVFIDADAAVEAACEIQQAATEFNRYQSDRGELAFPTRVGIDTGQVAIVSLGSQDRQDRTVLGTPVNLAKRLQEKAPPGQVWLSQATFARLSDQSGCRCIGPVDIKGLRKPVVVYER